jgi:hypothetical protein
VYIVFVRWGIAQDLGAAGPTVLRVGVAVCSPRQSCIAPRGAIGRPSYGDAGLGPRWPFSLRRHLAPGVRALHFAPASHGAVLPFVAMSVMGVVLGWIFLGERMSARKIGGA